MIWQIAMHEWRRLRASLMFWLLLASAQTVIAWLTFSQLETFAALAPQLKAAGTQLGIMELIITPSLNSLLLILLLSSPLLAMGGIAGERHSGRLALWLSAPLSSHQLIIGKVLGHFLGILPLLVSALITLAVLSLGVEIIWPRFALAGGFLILFAFWLASINTLMSSLVEHPAAALAASYICLLFLWLLDSVSDASAAWHWLALLPHVEPAFAGLLRSQDILFFTATGTAATLIAVYRVARLRGEI